MDDCNVPLGLKDIKDFFDQGSCSSAEPACLVERLPTKPHAGEVFLVANSTDSKEHWRYDGYRWRQNGRSDIPRANPEYTKIHFVISTPDGVDRRFQKFVYKHLHASLEMVIVQYIGDHTIAVDFPHGNSRQAINFVTCPTSLKEDLLCNVGSFNDLVFEKMKEPLQYQPRNKGQLTYFKGLEPNAKNIGWDPLAAIHELAYQLEGYVWSITTFPNLLISFGCPRFSEEIVRSCEDILISYDTTVNLGNLYMSFVVIKADYLVEEPSIPLGFIIHDRKCETVHEEFLHQFSQRFKPRARCKVVIVTDGDDALSNAVEKVCPASWTHVTCWIHILTDVEVWLKRVHASDAEIQRYKRNVQEVLQCYTLAELTIKEDTFRSKWSTAFVTYYDGHISKRIRRSFSGYLLEVGLKASSVTTNMSESLNAVIKRFQEWKEVPADNMLLTVYKLQLFYSSQIRRSGQGFGPYTLKKAKDLGTDDAKAVQISVDPEEIIKALRLASAGDKMRSVPASISVYSGELKVVHVPEQHLFTVTDDEGRVQTVNLFPKERCTCPCPTTCCHIIAAKRSIGIQCPERKIVNVTELKRNTRKKNDTKPGRKKARPSDAAPEALHFEETMADDKVFMMSTADLLLEAHRHESYLPKAAKGKRKRSQWQ